MPFSQAFPSTLREIITREKISPQKVFVSIFLEDCLTQQVTLPRMSDVELEQVILGEIEKTPFFASKEFEFGYYRYVVNQNKIKVIYSAVQQEVLRVVKDGIKALKLPLGYIEASPLNLIGLGSVFFKGGDEVLVVVDDRISYVMGLAKNQCRFFYSCRMGLLDMVPAKESVPQISAHSALSGEIGRIIRSYMLEYKVNPKRIWLVWDQENAPGLDVALGKDLEKEVNKIEPALAYKIRPGVFKTVNSSYLNACAVVVNSVKKLSKRFPCIRLFREDIARKALVKFICGAVIVAVIAGFVVVGAVMNLKDKKDNIARDLSQVSEEMANAESITAQFRSQKERLLATQNLLLAQANAIKFLNRVSWSKVFGEVALELPDGVALTSFKVRGSDTAEFNGDAFRIEDVSNLMRKVEATTVLHNPKFEFLRESKIEDKKIFSFGIFSEVSRGDGEKTIQ